MRQKQLVPEVVAAPLKALSSRWSLGFHPSTSSLPPHHASFQSSPVLLCSLTTFTSSLSKISFIICFQPTMQLPWHIHIYTFFSPSAILRSFYHNTFYQNDNIHLEDRSKQHQVESLSELLPSFPPMPMRAKSLQSCPTLYDPMDCSPLGSSLSTGLSRQKMSSSRGCS